ncbi:nitrilase family protein [Ophiostoma piceae UAMH 11346]|uniref:Nitrilase family protein n=1 Tax=Ophiostoma piceae (strain UAMH 11346) TaxID=1262450 RepID=S3BY77_OPHP1|nr:nitrilase family protein [Ophiostoma piceae UAMH 11346]
MQSCTLRAPRLLRASISSTFVASSTVSVSTRRLFTPRAHPATCPSHCSSIGRRFSSSTTTSSSSSTSTTIMSQKLPGAELLRKPARIACIQLASGADKAANLAHARDKVLEAARTHGANIVVLPECFNSPYGCDFFPSYAERLQPLPSADEAPSYYALAAMAKEAGVYLVGGSIPELAGDGDATTYYNTSLTFSPAGALLCTHRKVHLFDIDIPGKIRFKESDVLSPGNKVSIVELPEYGKIAIAICYDIRFPELAMVAARQGCFALVYPGAFNTTTGPLHWRLQGQARAMDNQVYVALCSPARDTSASYHAWGHSLVVDPMAQVLVEADENETIVVADLVADKIEETRKGIPLRDQRRFDVYPDVSEGPVKYTE